MFDKLRKEIEDKDKERERIIVESRPVIKNSKQAIYSIHRGDMDDAKKLIDIAESSLKKLKSEQNIGAYNAALQEYVEAITYYHYVQKGELLEFEKMNIDPENYLLGLCDLTGELGRRAVYSVINETYDEVKKINEFVSLIHDEFVKFEFRNSELRKKSDSIKWNLKKIEEIMYDLKIRGKI